MPTCDHNAIIREEARLILRPLGMTQLRRSRTWLDDHAWWLGVVEFQPSSWSKGTYLNVGTMWLWSGRDHVSYDICSRSGPFLEATNADQFRRGLRELCQTAIIQIEGFRKEFSTLSNLADFLIGQEPAGGLPAFNAAIAASLSGRLSQATALFRRVADGPMHNIEWVQQMHAEASRLLSLTSSPSVLVAACEEKVQRSRRSLRLRTIDSVLLPFSAT